MTTAQDQLVPRARGERRLAVVTGVIALFLTAALFYGLGLFHSSSSRPSPPKVSATNLHQGNIVPLSFRLARLGGGHPLQLASLAKGRPLVINVFASDCPACAAELHAFAHVARSKGRHVVFVGIDTNDPDPARALQLLRQAGANYPVGVDTPKLAVASAFGIANLPTTLFVSATGRLHEAVLGEMSSTRLQHAVQQLER